MILGILLLSLIISVPVGATLESAFETRLEQYAYRAQDNEQASINETIQQAQATDKLALFVFGAQWCHDSVALADAFNSLELHTTLSEYYVVQFIDVGYLQDKHELVQSLGYPMYFGTPTVLVIEPNQRRLINENSIAQWANAASMTTTEMVQYFEDIVTNHNTINREHRVSADNEQLQQYTQHQVARLLAGYARLGPILAKYDAGIKSPAFIPLWQEVKEFRVALQAELLRLRQINRDMAYEGTVELTARDFPALSWEQTTP